MVDRYKWRDDWGAFYGGEHGDACGADEVVNAEDYDALAKENALLRGERDRAVDDRVRWADKVGSLETRLAEAIAALHEIAHAHDVGARRLRFMAAGALIRHNTSDSATGRESVKP